MTPVKGIDPRITTPEMQTAYSYINRLGTLGGKILGLLWAFATVKVTPLVAVAVGLACLAHILFIGRDYRRQYPQIAKAFTGRYRVRLVMSAWPMLVVIVIVSGLLSKGLSWQQIGEYKEHVLALAAFPLFTMFKQWWNGQ
ncbi:hypothetical protein [Pseudomonas sp. MH10]|uniref:hypothetical protein n=1 Tax=Pseudomonas sp. MH10 TaxID=3048627 RepID=UPI002AC957DF|nr:hypothetical protein [Pseudomonas sp. MH10]MEB0043408.1 hypothetical protein [Pseudomonas sp. MH10]WPX63588.1 hypothetical protein RHM59_22370 [Pseudomonas sp. MH10]